MVELRPAISWPVDVLGLADRMGIRVVHRGNSPRELTAAGAGQTQGARGRTPNNPAGLEAGFKTDNGGEIHLWFDGQMDHLTTRARFSIAHEIAHFIVWRKTDRLPHSLDYWDHEDACDDFAGRLLIPSDKLEEFTASHANKDPIYLPALLQKQADVSWFAAAIAIARRAELGIEYVRFRCHTDRKGVVFLVVTSTVSGEKGKLIGHRAKVRKGPFFDFLKSLESYGPFEDGVLDVQFGKVDFLGCIVRGQRWSSDLIIVLQTAVRT